MCFVSEISGMKGEAAFVKTEKIDTMKDPEIIALFNKQRATTIRSLTKALEDIESKLSSNTEGRKTPEHQGISDSLPGSLKDFWRIGEDWLFFFKRGTGIKHED